MRAVLYVSHGTRVKAGVSQAELFIQSCMKRIPASIQEICYLELVDPDIATGISRCVDKGATEIVIQPVLLLSAGHVKKDIPEEVKRTAKRYPGVHFIYSQPFGCDPKIIDILSERIHEKADPNLGQAAVLLVGRGSSDPAIQEDFREITQALREKESLPVHTCFLAACKPSFKEGLDLMKNSEFNQIFVVPYLMFTGLLMKEMEEAVRHLATQKQTFILCESLGHHENLIQVLTERVTNALHIPSGVSQ